MKQLIKYFLRGLLIVVPIAVSVYVVYALFSATDQLLQVEEWFGISFPGLGMLVVVTGIVFAGYLGTNFLTRRLVVLVERLFARLPLVKLLYGSIRDLIGAFVGDKKRFDRPVAVQLSPHSNTRVLGFLTREDLSALGIEDQVAVYLPHSYNFSGNLIVVPRAQVTVLEADASDVMTMIVSGGVSGSSAKPA